MEYWKKFEHHVASGGGEIVPRSGAGEHEKLDVRFGAFLIDCKTDTKPVSKSFTIKLSQWENARQLAMYEGYLPAIAFSMFDTDLVLHELDHFKAFQVEIAMLRGKVASLRKKVKTLETLKVRDGKVRSKKA